MSSEFVWPNDYHRLKVFEEITETFEQPPSRLLSFSYCPQDPASSDVTALLLAFGPIQELVERRERGEVLVRFFDLRHTKKAAEFLGRYGTVDYLPDDVSDCVTIASREFAGNEAVEQILTQAGDVLSIKQVGQYLVAQFFDLRAAAMVIEKLALCGVTASLSSSGLENPYSDISDDSSYNSKHLTDSTQPLGASIGSDLTVPSPYMNPASSFYSSGSSSSYAESPSEDQPRRKPRKKRMDEEERALYTLNPQRILDGLDTRTTIMIKNIPNKYTQQMLLMNIDKHFANTYDFFYLPIDFKNKCNVGYAFVNFLDYLAIPAFYREMNGNKWGIFKSEKICAITYARIQGRAALIQHFQSSSVMSQEDAKIKPLIFPLTVSH